MPGAFMTAAFGHGLRPLWGLEEGMRFLNHGSYGATPKSVLAEQQAWRERMETQPVRFFSSEMPHALRSAARVLAEFLGTSGDKLVFVDNATTAVNTVLHSLPWRPGDELVLLRHAYPAVANAVRFAAERYGVTVRTVGVPLPVSDEGLLVASLDAAITPRTRLAVIDHISSPLSLVYPVETLVKLCRERGVRVLVDGAHAPGMLPLNLEEIGADWYTGNCHKWLYSPKGSAFLWATAEAQALLHPLAISLRLGEGFTAEFDWTGTKDPTPWLAVPSAVEFFRSLGLDAARRYMHELAMGAAEKLAQAWGTSLPSPERMLAAMVSIPLPDKAERTLADAKRLHDRLWEHHRIEVPVQCIGGRLWARISGQVYNQPEDYDPLADAAREELRRL